MGPCREVAWGDPALCRQLKLDTVHDTAVLTLDSRQCGMGGQRETHKVGPSTAWLSAGSRGGKGGDSGGGSGREGDPGTGGWQRGDPGMGGLAEGRPGEGRQWGRPGEGGRQK